MNPVEALGEALSSVFALRLARAQVSKNEAEEQRLREYLIGNYGEGATAAIERMAPKYIVMAALEKQP